MTRLLHLDSRLEWRKTRVLEALRTSKRPLTSREIARDIGMTSNEVGRLMFHLRVDGLVKRGDLSLANSYPGECKVSTWKLTALAEARSP